MTNAQKITEHLIRWKREIGVPEDEPVDFAYLFCNECGCFIDALCSPELLETWTLGEYGADQDYCGTCTILGSTRL